MRRTLIVEDNATFRKTFLDALHGLFPKMAFEEAVDGDEAIEKAESFRPDVIFMDIRLPGRSGLDVTEMIKESHPEIIIIILTDYDLPEYREAACFGGADEFVSKGGLNLSEIERLMERYA